MELKLKDMTNTEPSNSHPGLHTFPHKRVILSATDRDAQLSSIDTDVTEYQRRIRELNERRVAIVAEYSHREDVQPRLSPSSEETVPTSASDDSREIQSRGKSVQKPGRDLSRSRAVSTSTNVNFGRNPRSGLVIASQNVSIPQRRMYNKHASKLTTDTNNGKDEETTDESSSPPELGLDAAYRPLSRLRRSVLRKSYQETELVNEVEDDVAMRDAPESDYGGSTEPDSLSENGVLQSSETDASSEEEQIQEKAMRTAAPKSKRSKASETTKPVTKGIDWNLPPLSLNQEIFADMLTKALPLGLENALSGLKDRQLRVATMFSGLETPIIALNLICDALKEQGRATIQVDHVFSAEINVMKQAFIERNFAPNILFRDAREFIPKNATTATTAYGATVTIPEEIDILIAGFVCKDLSRMNNHSKNIDEEGETGDTFQSVQSYAEKFRPRVVLLENVTGDKALWEGVQKRWESIGYTARWHILDTKNYYLPQTRQRMYMVAVDNQQHGLPDQAAPEWMKTMKKLQRQCSSPFSSFLIDDKSESFMPATRVPEWVLCKLRYDRMRAERGLGTKRPITRWNDNGTVRPLDHADRQWFESQSTRVYEAIEVAHLLAAADYDIDTSYKDLVWDVSQNADRFKFTPGLAPCVTPGGADFITSRQTVFSAVELLRLQGMPVNDLIFAGETQKEMQDLAGNAMSATVIGASILSAIISIAKTFQPIPRPSTKASNRQIEKTEFHVPAIVKKRRFLPYEQKTLDLQSFVRDALSSSRLCACEGLKHVTDATVHICKDCGHTACSTCSGSPRHNYHNTVPKADRTLPYNFETTYRPKLPVRLKFINFPSLAPHIKGSDKDLKSYVDRIREVDVTSQTFTIGQFFRRDNYWEVLYASNDATLVLRIEEQLHWRLYIKCLQSTPGYSPLRKLLEHPVARGTIHESLINPGWEIFIPQAQTSSLSLAPSSQILSSWRSRIGLLNYQEETVPLTIEVKGNTEVTKDLSGTYKHVPHCGTSMRSLYKKISTGTSTTPIFLFHDANPIGKTEEDAFVFSNDCRRLPAGDSRITLGKLVPTWRPWMLDDSATENLTVPGVWRRECITLEVEKLPIESRVASQLEFSKYAKTGCSKSLVVLEVRIQAILEVQDFHRYSWALEQARLEPTTTTWMDWGEMGKNTTCHCAPSLPRTLWSVNEKSEAIPQEDRKAAAIFERAVKTRPKIIEIKASADLKANETQVQVAVNFNSLVHRTRSKLQKLGVCTISCRLVHHLDIPWEPFHEFRLQSNQVDDPYAGSLFPTIHELGEAQKRSLSWMRRQELGIPLNVTEVEEEVHSALGLRAEARAVVPIHVRGGILADLPSFGKTVTIIALIQSEINERKTLDTILKHNRQLSETQGLIDVAATLIVCPPHLVQQWKDEFLKFQGEKTFAESNILTIENFDQLRSYTVRDFQKARVVIVSFELLNDEAYISRLAEFAAMPDAASSDGRPFKAWMDYVVDKIPKSIESLQQSPSDFGKNTELRLQKRLSEEDFSAVVPMKNVKHGSAYVSWSKMQTTPYDAPSTSKDKKNPKPKVTRPIEWDSNTDWKSYPAPVLQMFRFNRRVVDEYHYLLSDEKNFPAHATVKRLSAVKKWGLSGTPALETFSDVNSMADLVGVTLGRNIYGDGSKADKVVKKLEDGRTAVENFRSRTEIRSYQWHKDRHQRAQEFLDQFVRQNEPQLAHIACMERLHPVKLDAAHHVLYVELCQDLNAQRLQLRQVGKKDQKDKHRVKNAEVSLENAKSAEEALLKRALMHDASKSLYTIKADRQQQYDDATADMFELMKSAEAHKKPTNPQEDFWGDFKRGVKANVGMFGDRDVWGTVHKLLKKAESQAMKARSTKTTSNIKALTAKIGLHASRDMAQLRRSLRFIEAIEQHFPALTASSRDNNVKCSSPSCNSCNVLQLAVLPQCGHLACDTCLQARTDQHSCVDGHCNNFVEENDLIRLTSLAPKAAPCTASPIHARYGAKMNDICTLITHLPSYDRGIVFVPSEGMLVMLEQAFKAAEISFTSVTKSRTSSSKLIGAFQRNEPTVGKFLILNLNDESASGSNLVNANHVIFVSPLDTDNQYKYDSAMAQAIARCRRFGQEKTVHIYHFAALQTIDVDILQHRYRRSEVLCDTGLANHIPIARSNSMEKEKTKMVRTTSGSMALVPVSWLADDEKREELGIEEDVTEDFGSIIDFGIFKEGKDD
jgi:site-specific DNA-cytosine methylase